MLLALSVWQLLAVTVRSPILLVTPVAVGKRMLTIWKEPYFFPSIAFTFCHVAAGYVLGVTAGCLLAWGAARFRWLEILFWPWIAAARSVPVASLVVICLIWLSSRNLSVLIVFLVVMPVIYHNTLTGFRVPQKSLEEMAQVFDMSRMRIFRYIRLPVLRPFLATACRMTMGMAWKAGVAAEVIGTPPGSIGKQIFLSKTYLAIDDLLAWTVIIVILGIISEKFIAWIFRT